MQVHYGLEQNSIETRWKPLLKTKAGSKWRMGSLMKRERGRDYSDSEIRIEIETRTGIAIRVDFISFDTENSHSIISTMKLLAKLSDIKKAQILAREFETALGPVVAGAFVPSEPAKTMEAYPNLLSKYQLLSGVTELESYHDFGVIELAHGMLETQRDDFVKKYVKLVFEGGEDVALKDILKQYSVQRGDPQRWSVESNTEFILNVFSDARAVAPLFKTVHYQSKANPRSYFYVFSHNSESTEHAALGKSVHGEELPYVLGVPLGGAETHFHSEYTIKEKLLSEAVMRLWTNFVKNGSPNTQSTRTNSKYNEYYTLDKSQWRLYNIDWPEYNVEHQSFLKLDIPPYVGSFYRSNYTRFWTEILPNKMKRYVVDPLFEFTHVRTTQKPKAVHRNGDTSRRNWNENTPPRSASTFYGRIKPHFPPPTHYNSEVNKETESISFPAKPVASDVFQRITTQSPTHNRHKTDENFPVKTSSTMMTLIILAIILFLLINIAVGTALYLKKKKLNSRQRNLESNINTQNRTRNNDKKGKEDKSALKTFKNGYSALKSMSINKMRSHSRDKKPKVEQCKTPKSDDSGGFGERLRLRRHLSTSTLDAHTKVRDWITNDVMHRCSPGFLRKSNSDLCNDTQITSHKPYTRSEELLSDTVKSKQILKQNISSGLKPHLLTKQSNDFKFKTSEKTTSTSAIGSHSSMEIKGSTSVNNNKKNIKSNDSLQSKDSGSVTSKKVSIAIDATPAARTNSILQQEPIEISKSFEKCEDDLKSTTTESNTLQKSKTDKVDDTLYKYKDKTTNVEDKNKIFTSIVSLPVSQDSLKGPLKISHKHSTSDPVTDVNYDEIIMKADFLPEKLTSIPPPALFGNEINVTSKEEKDYELLSPAEALLTIKRRNYPKVLPDFPSSQKRLSLQPSCQTIRSYINSLDNQIDIRPKLPPQPPPRTTTLERRLAYKNSKPLSSFGSSSNTLSQEGQLSQNYENIESLSSVEESYSPFNRKKEPFEQLNLSTFIKNREIPKVIIASSDVPDESRSKILITATPQRSSIDLPKYIPRVTLPDDFHSIPMNPFHSCTSSYSDDYDDTLGDEFLEDIADDKLIQELVGGVDSPTEIEEFLDTKGPDTDFPKNLEIVPVKVKTDVSQPRNEKDYIFISDLVLPDPSGSERTAQMKPHFTLNKADDRGESIQKPPEKTVKVKQKRSINPTAILSRAIKSKDLKAEPEKREGSNLYHSNSGSSNDTEASTGTVKRVIT
ncbi:Neuroligin-1 [Eumeta japonica]|uniref:Neuroligin-1 n=1 Tax=Eumeta variegata TaxID=151549 RepID=A0A4C1YDK0_EUMVA|nr:Neuroligin-1 [Eumeta japonica]